MPVTKEVSAEAITRNFPQKFESRHVRLPSSRQPADIDALKLVSPPVFADSDFLAYDTKKHKFTVTAQAATRLATSIRKLLRCGTPYVYYTGEYELIPTPVLFVLKARGESIYWGAFYTSFSSMGFDGPMIMAENNFIGTNVSKNATFSFYIDLGDAGPASSTPDPRGDARVVFAVRSLFASRKH